MVSVDELLFGICDRDITNVGSTLEHTSRMEKEKTAGGREGGRRRTTPNTKLTIWKNISRWRSVAKTFIVVSSLLTRQRGSQTGARDSHSRRRNNPTRSATSRHQVHHLYISRRRRRLPRLVLQTMSSRDRVTSER